MTTSNKNWAGTHCIQPGTGKEETYVVGTDNKLYPLKSQMQGDVEELQERVLSLELKLGKIAYIITNHLRIEEGWL